MTKLKSTSRLKVKRDTFYLPDPQGGVYFRNNVNSFRMEGTTIYQWIEKLIPMFNGEQSLGELTKGLTPPYRNRVYEIGETLYKNGFVRDVSLDQQHQLEASVLEKYASQIEFIENFTDSGAYRFQEYRQAKVLAIGSGPFLASLISALIESGLPKFHFMATDSVPTNRLRFKELLQNASKSDPKVEVLQVPFEKGAKRSFWHHVLHPYDWILYVSQDGNVKELKELNSICKDQKKLFLPAIYLDHVGLAGPLVHPESEACWESAWRRLHRSSLQKDREVQAYSSTAGSILANVIVFEFFKKVAGIAGSSQSHKIYQLDLETLEGDWIAFITHPLVSNKRFSPKLVKDLDIRLKQEQSGNERHSLDSFNLLTSKETGIFHTWEERNLKQLPLSQCYVQAVNPISEGPADLLPEVLCTGLTHEEAKREAGLKGIEMYASQMIKEYKNKKNQAKVNLSEGFIGVGAGETIAEAVCRGLQECLDEECRKRKAVRQNPIFIIQLETIEDHRCRFYLQALAAMNGSAPAIGLHENLFGFPVLSVGSNGTWHTSAGLTITLALENALQKALLEAQNRSDEANTKTESAVFSENEPLKLDIPSCTERTKSEILDSSIQILNRNNKQLFVYDLTFEPFLEQELTGVFGVQVREGES